MVKCIKNSNIEIGGIKMKSSLISIKLVTKYGGVKNTPTNCKKLGMPKDKDIKVWNTQQQLCSLNVDLKIPVFSFLFFLSPKVFEEFQNYFFCEFIHLFFCKSQIIYAKFFLHPKTTIRNIKSTIIFANVNFSCLISHLFSWYTISTLTLFLF